MKKARIVLQIHGDDNVGVALVDVRPKAEIVVGHKNIRVLDAVGFGHKIALIDIRAGEDVRKYGVSIGVATRDIATGSHVHTHNMKSRHLPQYSETELE